MPSPSSYRHPTRWRMNVNQIDPGLPGRPRGRGAMRGSGRCGDAVDRGGRELRGRVGRLARRLDRAAEQALAAGQGLVRGVIDALHGLAGEPEAGGRDLLGELDALLDRAAQLDPHVLEDGDRGRLALLGDVEREMDDAGQD